MNVLSLFDGMSCGMLALDRLGIKVDNYYASEIDKYAMQVSQANYPNIIQVGDITYWQEWDIDWATIDLVTGGFPCQSWSLAGKQLGDKDERGMLFWVMLDIMQKVMKNNPNAYYLMENVKMKKEFEEYITLHTQNALPNVNKYFIQSSLVSAQSRQRYYWTNIPNVEQPEERGIVLRDILEDHPNENPVKHTERNARQLRQLDEKSVCLLASSYKGAGNNGMTLVPQKLETFKIKEETVAKYVPNEEGDFCDPYNKKMIKGDKSTTLRTNSSNGNTWVKQTSDKPQHIGTAVDINGHDQIKRVYSPDGKSPTVTTCGGGHREPKVVSGAYRGRYNDDGSTSQKLELRKDQKTNTITTVQKDNVLTKDEVYWRKLTPLECERLQTVPDNYTNHVSNTQRYKMLGNGWTIEVIAHIFKNMESV